MKKKKQDTFENKISRLDEISSLLESEEIGLEEAMNLYEEGILLSKNCIDTLKNAEIKLTRLKKNLDNELSEEELNLEE